MGGTNPLGLLAVYERLLEAYGPQYWWPAETPFEVMVGAILTQNTAWTNVERALERLKGHIALAADAIVALPLDRLAERLKPAGYFNVKACRLQSFCASFLAAGGMASLGAMETGALRRWLLAVPGIGPETADDILLYAFQRPVFVVDAYTRRIFGRLNLRRVDEDYEAVRRVFETELPADVALFNEYHALIVVHGKAVCRSRPRCDFCCLRPSCPYPGSVGDKARPVMPRLSGPSR
jgi:endonuclease III related protein